MATVLVRKLPERSRSVTEMLPIRLRAMKQPPSSIRSLRARRSVRILHLGLPSASLRYTAATGPM
jgi:hypothetical protein